MPVSPNPHVALSTLVLGAWALCAAAPAAAQCALNEDVLLDCQIGDKRLSLCAAPAASVIYEFGTAQQTELRLHRGLGDYEYRPWPGIGRTIWESLRFENAGFTYEIYTSFDKIDREAAAGVSVLKGGSEVAHLKCDAGGEAFGFDPLHFALQDAGHCQIEDGIMRQGGC